MTGLLVAALLTAASLVLTHRRMPTGGGSATWVGVHDSLLRGPRPGSGSGHDARGGGRKEFDRRRRGILRSAGSAAVEPHEIPLFVQQLAGLLRAGRPAALLWADMEAVHADGTSSFGTHASLVLATARRAADLGLSVPDALREMAGKGSQGETTEFGSGLWADLAGCFEVAERSGAPLASIREYYAAQLESELEGVSARATALAGPRATVVLLGWLPVVGVVLGFALGINPLSILLGSFLGRIALLTGVLLMVVSRAWSTRLVRRAAGGAQP